MTAESILGAAIVEKMSASNGDSDIVIKQVSDWVSESTEVAGKILMKSLVEPMEKRTVAKSLSELIINLIKNNDGPELSDSIIRFTKIFLTTPAIIKRLPKEFIFSINFELVGALLAWLPSFKVFQLIRYLCIKSPSHGSAYVFEILMGHLETYTNQVIPLLSHIIASFGIRNDGLAPNHSPRSSKGSINMGIAIPESCVVSLFSSVLSMSSQAANLQMLSCAITGWIGVEASSKFGIKVASLPGNHTSSDFKAKLLEIAISDAAFSLANKGFRSETENTYGGTTVFSQILIKGLNKPATPSQSTHLFLDGKNLSTIGDLRICKALRVIHIDDNKLTSCIKPNLTHLSGTLTHLYCQSNQINTLSGVNLLKALRKLYVSHNNLTGLSDVFDLPNLEELHASDQQSDNFMMYRGDVGSRISIFNSLRKLVVLDVRSVSLRDEGISALSDARMLENLDIANNKLEDVDVLKSVLSTTRVRKLCITSNPVVKVLKFRDQLVATLPRLSQLDSAEITSRERVWINELKKPHQRKQSALVGVNRKQSHPQMGLQGIGKRNNSAPLLPTINQNFNIVG